MPASPTAIALLEFGKLIYEDERRHRSDRDRSRIMEPEEQLLELLRRNRATLRKTGLSIDTRTPQDSTVLRVVAYVSYQQLCSTKLGAAVCDVVRALAGEDPSAVLETRQTISRLLIAKQLVLKNGHSVELGQPMLEFLAGGKNAPPLSLTEWDLQHRWHIADAEAKRRKMREPIAFENMPTAKQLAERIAKDVVGLDREVRTLACRLALHIRRSALITAGRDPKSPNECILLIGASGAGKTFLAECGGRACGIPFGISSATDMTCEGFVGLSPTDSIKRLIEAGDFDCDRARFGACFIDEIDKKRTSSWEHGGRDVAGASVQQGLLKLVEGTRLQIGGRAGSFDWAPTLFDSWGTCFIFAGAFVGLDEILNKRNALGIGFDGRGEEAKGRQFICDALQDYGLIPEFVNRLTGTIVVPEPTIESLVQITVRAVLPAYQNLVATFGAEIRISDDAIRLMAGCARETRTFARGLKSVMSQLIEDTVFQMNSGVFCFGTSDVQRAIESAGLAAVVA
jgi:ATP-dependent Clp protease ATP-binding subunit ClpX